MPRRARPLLGTMVEVRARAETDRFEAAAQTAFAAVALVHRLMSFHEEGSDVRRIARARAGERVRVHAQTAAVLRHALHWAHVSDGAFDAGCGARAVAAGWLPAPADGGPPSE